MKLLEAYGHLTLATGACELVVQADRERIHVDLQHWRTALSLWRQRAVLHPYGGSLTRVQNALSDAGLTVYICLAGRTVAKVGAQAHPNLSARLLKLGPLELRPLTLGWACLQGQRQRSVKR